MDTKLTLKLDKFVIERAKKYAATNKRSLSRLIEAYLKSLTKDNPEGNLNDEDFEISPFVKSLATGPQIPLDIDIKSDYNDFLNQKYK
ncbi:hypothetical protein GM418_30780 [Maribellus comscasis]|uniref:Antitoxin n=1 Tax=Maribellus comscasis TaxID=2681766 RepID=A0A6I6JXW6_9BACT|nr:DUF6364 family protein [Maribellus comscasis]QGY47885.1 hypothetical protein GM418_30780 [Maribellus comscasis]